MFCLFSCASIWFKSAQILLAKRSLTFEMEIPAGLYSASGPRNNFHASLLVLIILSTPRPDIINVYCGNAGLDWCRNPSWVLVPYVTLETRHLIIILYDPQQSIS